MSRRGGGVLIAVNNNFPSSFIPIDCNIVEMIFVRVKIYGTWHIVGAVYIPPNSNINREFFYTVEIIRNNMPVFIIKNSYLFLFLYL